MAGLPRFSVPAWPFVTLPLVTALLLGAWNCREVRTAPRTSAGDLAEMDIAELVERLHAGGLNLRAVGSDREGTAKNNTFLTTTDWKWEQLVAIPKVSEAIERWKGTVYCERLFRPGTRHLQMQMWGDCCLQVGPFLFFGDRTLLARIRACLQGPDRRR